MSGGAQSFERGFHSMVDENLISSDKPSLPKTLDLVADVPNWGLSEYCARHKRSLKAR